MGIGSNVKFDAKIRLTVALLLVSFYTLATYLLPDNEWGFNNSKFQFTERLIFAYNIQIGVFGYTNPNIMPQTDRARLLLLCQRLSSYMFVIIMLL